MMKLNSAKPIRSQQNKYFLKIGLMATIASVFLSATLAQAETPQAGDSLTTDTHIGWYVDDHWKSSEDLLASLQVVSELGADARLHAMEKLRADQPVAPNVSDTLAAASTERLGFQEIDPSDDHMNLSHNHDPFYESIFLNSAGAGFFAE